MAVFEIKDPNEMAEKFLSEIKRFLSGNDRCIYVYINGNILHPENAQCFTERALRFDAERQEGGLVVKDFYFTPGFESLFGFVVSLIEDASKFNFIVFDGCDLIKRIPFSKMGYFVVFKTSSGYPTEVRKNLYS